MTLTDVNLSFFAVIWTIVCVLVGFWMGRRTQGPDPGIIDAIKALATTKPEPLYEEDPYYEPMTGAKQKRIQTVEDNE